MDLVPFRSQVCVCVAQREISRICRCFLESWRMKERVPWLRVVLELWKGLCPFPSCSFPGRSDKSGAAAPSPSTAALRPQCWTHTGVSSCGFHCTGFGFSQWDFLDRFEGL